MWKDWVTKLSHVRLQDLVFIEAFLIARQKNSMPQSPK